MIQTLLATIPQPPTHLPIPKTAEIIFTIFSFLPIPLTLAAAARDLIRRHDPLLLYCVIGGTLSVLFEPIVDILGLCFLKSNGAIGTFTIIDRTIPLYLIPVYTWYVGGLAYVFYRLFERGITTKMVFGLWAVGCVANIFDETPGLLMGVYTYYGHQPLNIWGLPLWWIFVNSLIPLTAATLIYKLKPRLNGWKLIAVIAFIPMADGIANAATAWPVWMALNQADVSYVWTYLAALVTIGLAGLFTWVVAGIVARPVHEATIVALSSLRTALRGTGRWPPVESEPHALFGSEPRA
jgi:hypothetical protein